MNNIIEQQNTPNKKHEFNNRMKINKKRIVVKTHKFRSLHF